MTKEQIAERAAEGSRYRELARLIEDMAKAGELRIRHFARNGTGGMAIGRVRAIPGSILELHTGYPETLRPGVDIAFQEKTHAFTVIAVVNGSPAMFMVKAENHEDAREAYVRMYGADDDSVVAVVPGEIGPIAVYGTLEQWNDSQDGYDGDDWVNEEI